uniref:Uncharacterized protein n=1 Tax=Cucumis melo TaxID=3656 RepID=A0A9I9CJW6_CUCME
MRRACPGAVAWYGEGWMVQQAPREWEIVTVAAAFVESDDGGRSFANKNRLEQTQSAHF